MQGAPKKKKNVVNLDSVTDRHHNNIIPVWTQPKYPVSNNIRLGPFCRNIPKLFCVTGRRPVFFIFVSAASSQLDNYFLLGQLDFTAFDFFLLREVQENLERTCAT